MTPARRNAVQAILDRGVIVKTLPTRESVIERLVSQTPARIYIGADPTGPELHLSHAKNYMLLEDLRKLGHHVIVLFGDFTAKIGDPTDRSSTRARLTDEIVAGNIKQWRRQIERIISFDDPVNPAEILLNSTWLGALTAVELVELAGQMTVQRMLDRSMFQRRLEKNAPIHLHEFFYPLFQGYDSVAMDIDIELCGTDQEFNALVGRTLSSRLRNRDKGIIEVHLMENPVTGELMSKSNGTGVFLSTTPEDLYGQVMALPDEMLRTCFLSVTRIPLQEIQGILDGHPRDAKMRLARDLVDRFHGSAAVPAAEEAFRQRFVARGFPDDAEVFEVPTARLSALDLALLGGLERFGSKSGVRRVIEGGGLSVNGDTVPTLDANIDITTDGLEVKLGKRLWFRVRQSG